MPLKCISGVHKISIIELFYPQNILPQKFVFNKMFSLREKGRSAPLNLKTVENTQEFTGFNQMTTVRPSLKPSRLDTCAATQPDKITTVKMVLITLHHVDDCLDRIPDNMKFYQRLSLPQVAIAPFI
jgi:hypothetical protein